MSFWLPFLSLSRLIQDKEAVFSPSHTICFSHIGNDLGEKQAGAWSLWEAGHGEAVTGPV